jgi:hypothetical protein
MPYRLSEKSVRHRAKTASSLDRIRCAQTKLRAEVTDFGLGDLQSIWHWIERYSDREVDFPDASLIWLATKKSKKNLLATTDFNDFETYQLADGKAFKNLIAR